MPALSSDKLTLLDWARRVDPNNSIAKVIEVLNIYSAILDDIQWVEGNLPTGHKVTIRASLPTPTWRQLNKGVARTKSTTSQITETVGMLEAYSQIDKDLAMLNGNTAEFRYSEDLAHIEALNQAFSTALFYGDTSTDPDKFLGLGPRYNALAGTTVYGNVIDGEGTGSDNTSVWLVGWSPMTISGIFPKGSQSGLQITDKGLITVYDSDSNPFEAYMTHFQWKAGIAIKDWRYVVRICNIDISDLETAGDTSDTSTDLIKKMAIAMSKIPVNGMVKPVFYCNRRVMAMLVVKLMSKSNTYLTMKDWQSPIDGLLRPTLSFMGIPVRLVESITNAETRIT